MKKIIYYPEQNMLIQKIAENDPVFLTNDLEIDDKELDDFKKNLSEWQKTFINKYSLSLNLTNEVFKGFLALFLNKCEALVLGYSHESKEVFLYAILFYGQEHFLSTAFITKFKWQQIWTDCALNISPNQEQLIQIVKNAINFALSLNIKPNVACLSYATYNSAGGKSVEDIKNTVSYLNEFYKDNLNIYIDGPLQFDASINLEIYKKKTSKDVLKNCFNIFVFPDLNAGNICYKIANQLAQLPFWGAFILGTNKIIVDLSRGAKETEINEINKLIKKMLNH